MTGENEGTASQIKRVLLHLLTGKSITPLDALNLYGCFRLGAIIFVLRKNSYNIQTKINENGKRYAIYTLISETQQQKLSL